MILLFKDYVTDYWIKNKIVDCGSSEYNQQLNINIKLENNEITNDEITNENNLILVEKKIWM